MIINFILNLLLFFYPKYIPAVKDFCTYRSTYENSYFIFSLSGQGSDPTGSDTSTWSDQERARHGYQPTATASHLSGSPSGYHQLSAAGQSSQSSLPPSGYQPPGSGVWSSSSAVNQRLTSPSPDRGAPLDQAAYGYARRSAPAPHLPPYRHPPQPGQQQQQRHPSPSGGGGDIPPPYREPPPPPGSFRTSGPPLPTSPTQDRRHMSPPAGGRSSLPPPHPHHPYPPHSPTPPRSYHHHPPPLRAPHYSPPPHHRELPGGRHHGGSYAGGGSRGPSPGRTSGGPNAALSSRAQGSPARGHSSPSSAGGPWRGGGSSHPQAPPDSYSRGGSIPQVSHFFHAVIMCTVGWDELGFFYRAFKPVKWCRCLVYFHRFTEGSLYKQKRCQILQSIAVHLNRSMTRKT